MSGPEIMAELRRQLDADTPAGHQAELLDWVETAGHTRPVPYALTELDPIPYVLTG